MLADARTRLTGVRRWVLGSVTLALAIGVVVMHSLGLGHHGPSLPHHGSVTAQHGGALASTSVPPPAETAGAGSVGHASGHASPDADAAASVAVAPGAGAVVAISAAGPGAMAVCLAVLPVLLLLRRGGDRTWFARALPRARRLPFGARSSSSTRPPGRAGPTLSELCILRT
jgi:hypothetical protein